MTASQLKSCAVVLAAHGDRGGSAPNATLMAHCNSLQATGTFASVTAGVFRGDPRLEDALQQADHAKPSRIFVYPMFMAAGYFTNQKLPEYIKAASLSRSVDILAPLGLDPSLPPSILNTAIQTARNSGHDPAHTRLLVVGHGSAGSRASAKSTERVACWLRKQRVFAYTEAAFLEEEPFLEQKLKGPHPTTVVAGFFSGDGLHAAEDVPGAISETAANAIYAGPIGKLPIIPDLIKSAVEKAIR